MGKKNIHRIYSTYMVMEYTGNYYDAVEKIKKSKCYTAYIDHTKDKGVTNKSYENYLKLKNYLYASKVSVTKKQVFAKFVSSNVSEKEKKIVENSEMKIDDYYTIDTEVIEGSDVVSYISKIKLTEDRVLNRSLKIDNWISKWENQFMTKGFMKDRKQRFILIPFLAKKDKTIVEPMVVLTVYDMGLMSLQYIIGYDLEELTSVSNNDTHIELEDVKVYKREKRYTEEDFFEMKNLGDCTVEVINRTYLEMINDITGSVVVKESIKGDTVNIIGDFKDKKKQDCNEFINKNSNKLYQLYTNIDSDIERCTSTKYMKEKLNQGIVMDRKNIQYYVNKILGLAIINDMIIDERIRDNLKKCESELKDDKVYDDIVFNDKKEIMYNLIWNLLKCYELSLLKKYYGNRIMLKIHNKRDEKDLMEIKSNLDFVRINLEPEILFADEGSPKELYIDICNNSGSEYIIERCESLFRTLIDSQHALKEEKNKELKDVIMIITAIVTSIVSFVALKTISYEVGIRLGSLCGWCYLVDHPLKVTVIMWMIVNLVMLWGICRYMKKRGK